mgnify:FL=1
MSTVESIDFAFRGKVDGVAISPRTIGLSQFNEFNQQAEVFLAGADRAKLNQVQVEILEGSYVVRSVLGAAVVLGTLESDLLALERQDVLGELDPKRAEVVQKWQARAKADPDIEFEIRPNGQGFASIAVNHQTDYRVGAIQPWVVVERYLHGEIMDMGGAQKANIHLKLARGGKTIIVGTSQGYLHDQEENRLYHKVLLHVRAEQHHRTGALRNVRLIAFADYHPVYDAEALDRFAAEGEKAWAGVPDAAAWVRELRGE